MKKILLWKILVIGIILLFVGACNVSAINTKNGLTNEIEFPKEDGPYIVYLCGWNLRGSCPYPLYFSKEGFTIGPFSFYKYSKDIIFSYLLYPFSIFIVNGTIQKYDKDNDYVNIYGFKGYAPGLIHSIYGSIFTRTRVFCICDEIDISDHP